MITRTSINRLLENIADSCDITDSMYQKVTKHYNSLSQFFKQNELRDYDLEIYPQGSFSLGTAIKPVNDDGQYDVDLVCKVYGSNANKRSMTQKQLKELVGSAVKKYCGYYQIKKAPINNSKCWTIEYLDTEQFHMDIVPALPDQGHLKRMLMHQSLSNNYIVNAINITDSDNQYYSTLSDEWPISNPKGYSLWFKSRIMHQIEKLAESRRVDIESIGSYQVKSKLQKVIQLLKRHRDMVVGEVKGKPASIIISTIAAQVCNQDNFLDDIELVLNKLKEITQTKELLNPSNPLENFACKLEREPYSTLFNEWVSRLRNDIDSVLKCEKIEDIAVIFDVSIGNEIIKEAFEYFKSYTPKIVKLPDRPVGLWS